MIPQHFGISTPTFSYDSWRVYLALCILPSATSAFIFVLMPESPRFLMQMGKEQEALRVFQRVYASNHGCSGDQYPVSVVCMPSLFYFHFSQIESLNIDDMGGSYECIEDNIRIRSQDQSYCTIFKTKLKHVRCV